MTLAHWEAILYMAVWFGVGWAIGKEHGERKEREYWRKYLWRQRESWQRYYDEHGRGDL